MKKLLHFNAKWMGRDVALSFLGTTLSIVLTFGSSAIYERYQQKKAQRLTTMMIVHDMDGSVAEYQRLLDGEAKAYDVARYALSHCDEIDSLPIDTVISTVTYLVDYKNISFDDSKEKIFNSSYDSWNNIDNMYLTKPNRHVYANGRMCMDSTKSPRQKKKESKWHNK